MRATHFEMCLGFAGEKARLKYGHRSPWNVTTWRLSGEAGFLFLAGYENRHMDPDPVVNDSNHGLLEIILFGLFEIICFGLFVDYL